LSKLSIPEQLFRKMLIIAGVMESRETLKSLHHATQDVKVFSRIHAAH